MTTSTTTQINTADIQVRTAGAGRPITAKTQSTRRAVLRVMAKNQGDELSTKEIAKLTKQSKTRVIAALRWAEGQDLITRSEKSVKHSGRGRPMSVYSMA